MTKLVCGTDKVGTQEPRARVHALSYCPIPGESVPGVRGVFSAAAWCTRCPRVQTDMDTKACLVGRGLMGRGYLSWDLKVPWALRERNMSGGCTLPEAATWTKPWPARKGHKGHVLTWGQAGRSEVEAHMTPSCHTGEGSCFRSAGLGWSQLLPGLLAQEVAFSWPLAHLKVPSHYWLPACLEHAPFVLALYLTCVHSQLLPVPGKGLLPPYSQGGVGQLLSDTDHCGY